MPYIRIWVHLIWATKDRVPVISNDWKHEFYAHIRENAKKKEIYLDFINGYTEHVHALISLNADQAITKVAQLIKGESSHWVNQQNLIKHQFAWQEEYIAVSVSESLVNKVRTYIKNQEEHHRLKTFAEEYQLFIEKYGFHRDGSEEGVKTPKNWEGS